MKRTPQTKAFTLLEILIATGLIVLIVSVCYGTFKAVTQSTARIKPNIDAAPAQRALTTQIARQLRGCFANLPDNDRVNKVTKQLQDKMTRPIIFFAKQNAPDGTFLQYLTTHGFYFGKDQTKDLLAVRYRFDTVTHKWFYQQQSFIQGNKLNWTDNDLAIADNIETLTIRCFDGKTWKNQWDFAKTEQLPAAIHIEYTTRDHNGREQNHSIIANINTQAESKDDTTSTPDHAL